MRDGLGAVLAEVEGRPLAVRIWPGTAGTVEAVLLVELQQRQRAADQPGFTPGIMKAGNDGLDPRGLALRLALAEADQPFRCFGVHVAVRAIQSTIRYPGFSSDSVEVCGAWWQGS